MGSDDRSIVVAVTASRSLTFYRELVNALARSGWSVHLVAGDDDALDAFLVPGVEATVIPMRRQPSPVVDLLGLLRWIRLCRRLRPSVVIAGTPKASLLALVSAWLTRRPHRIYHLLGLRLETTRGISRRILRFLERITYWASSVTLPVSQSLQTAFVSELGIDRSKLHVIGHGSSGGVDEDFFKPSEALREKANVVRAHLGLAHDKFTIGFVGRIVRDKGIETLAGAARLLEREGCDFQILVVGNAEEDLPRSIDSLKSHVALAGFVPDMRVPYALMDVLCLPTYREGFPNVALEAASMEIPVVTTTATGAVDSVVHGQTGWTSAPGDAPALAKNLFSIMNDSLLRSRMGIEGRKRVLAKFRRSDVVRAHLEFIESLVG